MCILLPISYLSAEPTAADLSVLSPPHTAWDGKPIHCPTAKKQPARGHLGANELGPSTLGGVKNSAAAETTRNFKGSNFP